MEFMWHSFPPPASCPPLLSLAVLFMFAHMLFFSTIISHPGKFMLGMREKAASLTGRRWFWLRFEVSYDLQFNIVGYDRQDNLILFGFINH